MSPADPGTDWRARRFWCGTPFGAAFEDGDDRISQVPGEPRLSIGTCSSTPAGCVHLTNAMLHLGPRYGKPKGTDIKSFEAQ